MTKNKSLPGKLVLAIVAAGIGTAFQHGYNTGVTNVPTDLIIKFINETSRQRNPNGTVTDESVNVIFSTIVSVFAIGGMFGALATGFVADKVGRRAGLLYNNILVLTAAGLMGFAKSSSSYEMLMAGRFIIGVNSGLNAGLGPMYLSEISPVHFRGAIGTIYQLIVTISILASNILGSSSFLGTEALWPVLLAATVFGSVVMLVLFPLCPESPNFLLIIKENDNQAQKALIWLRGTTDVHDEMEEMKRQADEMKKVEKVTLGQMWTNQLLRKPLIISLIVMMGQQLSGINAVMFYSSSIFQGAGLDASGAYIATLVMGVINVAMTFVSLILIDRAGRKILLMLGFGGMALTTVIFVICLNLNNIGFFKYVGVIAVFFFVVMFATGPGSIPWFLVSELFAVNARGIASSLAVSVNWGANFIVGLSFLPINLLLGSQTFLIFTVILTFMVFYTKRCVPETKGRTIEEIQAEFRQTN